MGFFGFFSTPRELQAIQDAEREVNDLKFTIGRLSSVLALRPESGSQQEQRQYVEHVRRLSELLNGLLQQTVATLAGTSDERVKKYCTRLLPKVKNDIDIINRHSDL